MEGALWLEKLQPSECENVFPYSFLYPSANWLNFTFAFTMMNGIIGNLLKAEEEKELGNSLFKKGDYELSIFHYTRSINYQPNCSLLYTNRSLAYFKIGAYDKSLEDALKAKDIDENNLKSYYRICEAYNALNDEENYEKFLKIYNEKRGKKLGKNEQNTGKTEQNTGKTEKNAGKTEKNAGKTRNGYENLHNDQNCHSDKNRGHLDKRVDRGGGGGEGEREMSSSSGRVQQNDIRRSTELVNLCDRKEEDPFLFFKGPQTKERNFDVNFEKEKYRNNFLIEEVYDFKEKKENLSAANDNRKKKNDLVVHAKSTINYSNLYDDIDVFSKTIASLFEGNTPLAVHIKKETGKKITHFDGCNLATLKSKADMLFSEKKYYLAMEIYTEMAQWCDSEKGVYYSTILSNRSACFIEMKKVRSSLCDISATVNIILPFLEKHKENIKKVKDKIMQPEHVHAEQPFFQIDLDIYKDVNGIYYQAHKLLIKLFLRYAKFSPLHSGRFKVPSLQQVDTFSRMKGMCYINHDEVEKLKNTIYSKL
ncbi:conserved Plasmodium protein, unknown function [Plasmodium ovale wallikeri]|uniref:Uncharacterized protein n=1 Tax=Plasmodium ovale wallikeri TaxID=864142 RepID=A0A1A8YJD6_PLAOA|nr:conserved Plasmodium protein, unknown function [Plasmodium ovale wallikeri]